MRGARVHLVHAVHAADQRGFAASRRTDDRGDMTVEQGHVDFYYGKGLLDEGKVDAGLSALSRVSDTPVGAYYMAVGFAKKSQEKNAMDYLQRAAEKKPEYWDYAGKNEHFKALAARSSDFAYFLEHKGKPRPVEPAVIPGNEVKNEKAKDTSP
jgi:hypothetical protein